MGSSTWMKSYEFDDEKVSDFKNSFVDYINSFWIQGCFPPRTWNTYERSEDYTNNAQVIAILKRLYSIQCIIERLISVNLFICTS